MAQGRAIQSRKRGPLFVGLAQKALDRGDAIRATVTLLEGLRRHPHLIPEHLPHTLTTFAQAVHGPGLERELLDVLSHCPQPDIALAELYSALRAQDKDRAIDAIERARARHLDLAHIDVPRLAARVEPRFVHNLSDALSTADAEASPAQNNALVEFEAAQDEEMEEATVSVVAQHASTGQARHAKRASAPAPPWSSQSSRSRREVAPPRARAPRPQHVAPLVERTPSERSKVMRSARKRSSVPPTIEALRAREETGRPPHRRDGLTHSPQDAAAARARIDSERGSEPRDPRRRRLPSLQSAGSVDALLSEAVMAAESELGSAPSVTPRTSREPGSSEHALGSLVRPRRGARFKGAVLAFVALLILGGVAYSLYDRMEANSLDARLEAAAELASSTRLTDLKAARSNSLAILEEWPDSAEAFAQAFLFDRLVSTRFGETSHLEVDDAPTPATALPAFRVGLVLEHLAHDRIDDARRVVLETPESRWSSAPGLQEWAGGLILVAQQRPRDAARALAMAVDKHELPLLPLLDLAQLALSSRDAVAITLFSERAQPRRAEHPLLSLGLVLVRGDLSAPPDAGLAAVLADLQVEELSSPHAGWYWMARSWTELHSGDLDDAHRSVSRGLELTPTHPDLLLLDGLVSSARDRVDEARPRFAEALAGYAEQGRQATAIRLLENVLSNAGRPDLIVALLGDLGDPALRAEALLHLGRADEALDALQAAPQPTASQILYLSAASQPEKASSALAQLEGRHDLWARRAELDATIASGSWDAAYELAAKLSTTHPESWPLLQVRSELMAIHGQGKDAAALVSAFGARLPLSTRSDVFAGLALSRSGSLDAADAARLSTLDATDVSILEAQAEIAWRAGLAQEAVDRTREVLELTPDSPNAHAVLGLMADKPEDAIPLLKKADAGHRTLPEVALSLAHHYRSSGQSHRAIQTLEQAMARPVDRLKAVNALGELFHETGLHRKGTGYFKELILTVPDAPQHRKLRGTISLWMGILENPTDSSSGSSLRHLKKARLSLGDDPRVLFHLGQAYESRNKMTQARELYEHAARLDHEGAAHALDRVGPAPGDAPRAEAPKTTRTPVASTSTRKASKPRKRSRSRSKKKRKAKRPKTSTPSETAQAKTPRTRKGEPRKKKRSSSSKRTAPVKTRQEVAKRRLNPETTRTLNSVIVQPFDGAVELARIVFGVR